jgi:hypothetical protein
MILGICRRHERQDKKQNGSGRYGQDMCEKTLTVRRHLYSLLRLMNFAEQDR